MFYAPVSKKILIKQHDLIVKYDFSQTSESVFPFQIVSALPDLRLGTVSADAGQRILSALSRVDLMTSYFRCCEKVCRFVLLLFT